MPIGCDYHLHTPRCKHAAGPLEAYVERAIELGLSEIGFSDHNPLPDGLSAHVRMAEWELEHYVADVLRVRDRYRGQIAIRLGLEMDYLRGREAYLARQQRSYPWDYVIGSVHYLDPECTVGAWSRQPPADIDAHYEQYFALVRELAASGLCDIVAHFDIPRRSMRPPRETQDKAIRETLETLHRHDISMEVNTSGYRHVDATSGAPYPNWDIVGKALQAGVALSVNSDSHAPGHVGTEFSRATEHLRRLGCRELARFKDRQRTMYPLE